MFHYKLTVVLCLTQHISETTVGQKQEQLRHFVVVLCLIQHISKSTVEQKLGQLRNFVVKNLPLQTRPLFDTTDLENNR